MRRRNSQGSRFVSGERHPRATAPDAEVSLVRQLYGAVDTRGRRISLAMLAEKFERPRSTIQYWVKGYSR